MSRQSDEKPRIHAVREDGRRVAVKAESLEITFSHGRRMVLEFPPKAWGDLSVMSESNEGTPVITVQPGGCNLLTLRADVQHHMMLVDTEATLAELDLTVQKALSAEDKGLPRPSRKELRRWAGAALEQDATVTVRFVSEDEGRSLNARFRSKDYATNVLTFVYDDETGDGTDGASLEDRLYGDLVLCVPVVAREAAEQDKDLQAHYAHLVVHGMLHLQGYDHEHEVDADVMEAREREILAALGFPDPYADETEQGS